MAFNQKRFIVEEIRIKRTFGKMADATLFSDYVIKGHV